jgi:hypothetical protein
LKVSRSIVRNENIIEITFAVMTGQPRQRIFGIYTATNQRPLAAFGAAGAMYFDYF